MSWTASPLDPPLRFSDPGSFSGGETRNVCGGADDLTRFGIIGPAQRVDFRGLGFCAHADLFRGSELSRLETCSRCRASFQPLQRSGCIRAFGVGLRYCQGFSNILSMTWVSFTEPRLAQKPFGIRPIVLDDID